MHVQWYDFNLEKLGFPVQFQAFSSQTKFPRVGMANALGQSFNAFRRSRRYTTGRPGQFWPMKRTWSLTVHSIRCSHLLVREDMKNQLWYRTSKCSKRFEMGECCLEKLESKRETKKPESAQPPEIHVDNSSMSHPTRLQSNCCKPGRPN